MSLTKMNATGLNIYAHASTILLILYMLLYVVYYVFLLVWGRKRKKEKSATTLLSFCVCENTALTLKTT